MSLRHRVTLTLLATVAVAVALGVVAVVVLRSVDRFFVEERTAHQREVLVRALELEIERMSLRLTVFLAGGGDRAHASYKESLAKVRKDLVALLEASSSPEDREPLEVLQREIETQDLAERRARFLAEKNPQFDYLRRWIEERRQPVVREQIQALVERSREQSLAAAQAAERQQQIAYLLIVVGFLALLVIVVWSSFLLRRWLIQPIVAIQEATRQIAKGEYKGEIEVRSGDELGTLARDIEAMSTSIGEYQSQLVGKERLAAIGEMTASVAHNLRNPLASIRALAQSSQRQLEPGDDFHNAMTTVMKTVDKADRWLKDLLVDLRPVRVDRAPEDLNRLLETTVEAVVEYGQRRDVSVHLELSPELPPVEVDRRKLNQAVISLLTNAVDASPGGATVRILSQIHPEHRDHVLVTVADDGPGLTSEQQKKMFVPSFTTKHNGTGMGLSLTQRIVFGHHGRIQVDSGPGQGCRMKVSLPIRNGNMPHGTNTHS